MFVSLERFAGVDRVIIMVVDCGFGEDVGPLDRWTNQVFFLQNFVPLSRGLCAFDMLCITSFDLV